MLQVDIDFETEPIGTGKDGKSIYFKDLWPSTEEIAQVYIEFPAITSQMIMYEFNCHWYLQKNL